MASPTPAVVPLSPEDGGVTELQHHQLPEEIKCVAFSPAGGSIATGGTTGRVRVFSAHDFEIIWDFEHHRDSVSCCIGYDVVFNEFPLMVIP